MKKLASAIFYFALSVTVCLSQHEYDVWYFGNNAGVDFTTGAPVVLTNGQAFTVEGTASIADSAGNLFFYTDGVTVWNKNHQVMTNGTNLHGGVSSSQSALIIRQPDSDSLFYIFTTGEQTAYGFSYSIVDITLQSGLGEVIVKNVGVLSPSTEKLTSARHSNGTDYWIIVHGWTNNNFYAYQFSDIGMNTTPVISSIGTTHNGNTANTIGYMKASHNSKHIALCLHDDNYFELFDFDNSTGVVSNDLFIDGITTTLGPYGIEFSPNDSLLYGGEYQPGKILQWDISSGNAATILASQVIVGTTNSLYGGALGLASDGKIYMAQQDAIWLGAIEFPNIYGTGCNYVDHAVNVSPKLCQSGLPNIPPDALNQSSGPPAAAFVSSDNEICPASCINFTDQSTNNPDTWMWYFDGGIPDTSTDQHPSNICYDTTGTYDVTLIATNSTGSDTIVLQSFITVFSNPVVFITATGNVLLSTPAITWQWYYTGTAIAGATAQSYSATQSGNYSVQVTDSNGCTGSADYLFSAVIISSTDTSLCEKFCIDFHDQSSNSPVSWQWIFEGADPAASSDQHPVNICYDNPGTFDVILITADGSGNNDTLTLSDFITVYPNPFAPVITQSGNTLSSSPADSYQWLLNGIEIPGATNQSYEITQSGLYTVVIEDANGCSAQSDIKATLVGVDEILSGNVTIYPNPSSGSFIIEYYGDVDQPLSIDVINSLGQIIFSSEEESKTGLWKKEIDLGLPANGVYLIELKSDAGVIKKKLVITQ